MNTRQRAINALNHKESDRAPIDLGSTNVTSIHISAYKRLISQLGIEDLQPAFLDYAQQMVKPCEKLLTALEIDFRGIKGNSAATKKRTVVSNDEYIDEWGLVWSRKKDGHYFDTFNAPLKDFDSIEQIREYEWPEIIGKKNGHAQDISKANNEIKGKALVGSFGSSVFMRAQLLRGYEQLFIDVYENEKIFHEIMNSILAVRKKSADILLAEYGPVLDVVEIADDLAGQAGPLMSLRMYREHIKPYTSALIKYIKEKSTAKIMYHCCGAVQYFIGDLIEAGVDIINPVQVSAVGLDTKAIKEEYGDKLVFWGGIDLQGVLTFGSIKDVEKEVNKRLDELGAKGGFVACPSHNIQPDVKTENIIKMYEVLLGRKLS